MTDSHSPVPAHPVDPVESVVHVIPVVLPAVGAIMIFLLAMIAVYHGLRPFAGSLPRPRFAGLFSCEGSSPCATVTLWCFFPVGRTPPPAWPGRWRTLRMWRPSALTMASATASNSMPACASWQPCASTLAIGRGVWATTM
jgi:hypothetical protein